MSRAGWDNFMPPPPGNLRKRKRKRNRRVASSSSSSSDSSLTSSNSDAGLSAKPLPPKKTVKKAAEQESSTASSSSSSSSDSDSDSESDALGSAKALRSTEPPANIKAAPQTGRSPSTSPPPFAIPPFIPPKAAQETSNEHEQILKDRFRKFWMVSVAEGFRDDLEEIRKEPNLGTSRLALLIDSLASGADVFTSSTAANKTDINEMQVVLDSS